MAGFAVKGSSVAVAILAGAAAFGATDHQDYIAAWIALVVGLHFVALAKVFGQAGRHQAPRGDGPGTVR